MRILTHVLLLTLAVCLSVPKIVYQASYNSYSYSAFPNDTCQQIQITKNYIFRLGRNNVLSATNKTSLANTANMLNYTYTTNGAVVATPPLVQNFNVDQNQTYLTLAMTTSTKILNLMSFSLKASTMTSPFQKVIFNNLTFTGFKKNPAGITQIYNVKYISQAAFAATSVITFSIPGAVLPNVNNCQCSHSPNSSYLVYWDQYSNVFVYNYTNTSVPPSLIGSLPSNLTVANLTQAISFSPDGEHFLLEVDAALPVTIVSLSPAAPLSTRSFAFNGTITRALFLDSASAFVVLFNDSAYAVASVAMLSVLESAALSVETQVIEVDQAAGKVYLCKNSSVEVYNASYPTDNCSSNCAVCSSPSLCLACNPNYALSNNTCQISMSITTNSTQILNLTNSSNNSTSNSPNLLSNNTSNSGFSNSSSQSDSSNSSFVVPSNGSSSLNSSQNQSFTDNSAFPFDYFDSIQNQTMFIIIMPDGSVIVLEVTFAQAKIINTTQQAIQYSNVMLQKLMVFLTSSPFIFVFLGNIQFFTISSLYALLNLPIPLDLYNSLKATVNALNTNIFVILGMNLTAPKVGVERVKDQKPLDLGISTLFLPSNYQSIILTSFIIALVAFIRKMLSQCKAKSTKMYHLISENKNMIVFGLLVSGFIQLILPYANVYSNAESYDFGDKINQSIQFIIVGLIIAFVGLFSASVGYKGHKLASTAKKIKITNNQYTKAYKCKSGSAKLLKRQRDNIYLVLLNVAFPMLVVLRQPLYFLIGGLLIFVFGAAKAICCTVTHRANKIALSIYPILFHICFSAFYFSSSSKVIVIAQISCLLIYFLGSLHQFLTILYEIISFVCRIIKANCKKQIQVAPQSDTSQNKTGICSFTTARMRSKFKHNKITKKDTHFKRNTSLQNSTKIAEFTLKHVKAQNKQESLFGSAIMQSRNKRARAKPVNFIIKKELVQGQSSNIYQ